MPRAPSLPGLLAATGAWCACLLTADPVEAYDVQVSSSTVAQGYWLRSPWGEPVLSRRRLQQSLGLQVTEPQSEAFDRDAAQFTFRMRMRLDADFGIEPEEFDADRPTTAYVPGLDRAPVDLMYAYLDVTNLAQGMLSARLGRQYMIDPLGWWSFDGGLLRVELPVYLAFETYGGLEQRGGMPLSSPRFERDGVWRGDRTGLGASTYPEFLPARTAPAHGVMLETHGLPVVHGSVAYRKVWNTGEAVTNPFPARPASLPDTTDGMRISSQRVAAAVDLMDDELGAVRAAGIYDLYAGLVSSAYASADLYVSRSVTLGADADRIVPTFDGDAIWNWFAVDPMTTVTTRADVQIAKSWDAGVAPGFRVVDVPEAEGAGPGSYFDVLGRASSRYRLPEISLGLSGLYEYGERGRRQGLDVFGEQWFEKRYLGALRLSVYDWHDELRPDRSATSFGYVLSGGYRVGNESSVLLEWEHDTNRLVGQRYRVLAMLQVMVDK